MLFRVPLTDKNNKNDSGGSLFLILIMCLLIAICSSSCISTKPARSLNKAENKIIKYHEGIQNQIDKFPNLAEKAFTRIVKEEYIIPPDSAYIKRLLFNLDSINKNTEGLVKLLGKNYDEIDSLLSVLPDSIPENCDPVVQQLQANNRIVLQKLRYQQNETTKWFNNYYELLSGSIKGTYIDSSFVVEYEYLNGDIIIRPKTNPKKIIVDKEEYDYNIDIRKNFWQDFKFYPFLIVLTSIFYFFGTQIFGFIKIVVSLIRKLIFKI